MLKIECTKEKCMCMVKGDIAETCTELTLALRGWYEELDEDSQYTFRVFLEDALPTLVCEELDRNKLFKVLMESIVKRSGAE